MEMHNKCSCEYSTGSTHIECCNICGLPLQKENWHFFLPDEESNQVQAGVKPACKHKLTAKQFFIEQYQEGKCEDITTNPYPEFNNAFYQNIYKLMEDYSKSV